MFGFFRRRAIEIFVLQEPKNVECGQIAEPLELFRMLFEMLRRTIGGQMFAQTTVEACRVWPLRVTKDIHFPFFFSILEPQGFIGRDAFFAFL